MAGVDLVADRAMASPKSPGPDQTWPAIVDMPEAMGHLSELLERVEAGEDVVIAREGRPVARLIPFARSGAPRTPGRHRGQIRMADDFDRTPDDVIDAFESDIDL